MLYTPVVWSSAFQQMFDHFSTISTFLGGQLMVSSKIPSLILLWAAKLCSKEKLSWLSSLSSTHNHSFQMRQNFLLLLLNKTLVMETAHISFFPSQNCGSEVLPNANCIPSEEDGKNQNKPNRPAKQKLSPNFEQLLIPFPPLTPLQNQDYITEQVSFNFPHQLPLKSPKKI